MIGVSGLKQAKVTLVCLMSCARWVIIAHRVPHALEENALAVKAVTQILVARYGADAEGSAATVPDCACPRRKPRVQTVDILCAKIPRPPQLRVLYNCLLNKPVIPVLKCEGFCLHMDWIASEIRRRKIEGDLRIAF